jgi:UDP-GlcNAc:undecaprenyl-phosphate GlcNAc-1-phosphate transferase
MQVLLVFLTSLSFVVIALPQIIAIAVKKKLFDIPLESRRVHKQLVPQFGGIALFLAFLFTYTIFIPAAMLPQANIIIAASLIVFLTGLKDDILAIGPLAKFIPQVFSALLLILAGGFRIDNLHGVLGIYELPAIAGLLLTLVFVVGIVNAFNLIDGIDGLAGTIGSICMLMFALLFHQAEAPMWSLMALSLAAALLGFLYYNITPAKIFMGDCGSLFLGLMAAVFSIRYLNIGAAEPLAVGATEPLASGAANGGWRIAMVAALLMVPVFDTLRVFALRLRKGSSPFTADDNHLHHRLLAMGLNHVRATSILSGCTILFITLSWSMRAMNVNLILLTLILTALIGNEILAFIAVRSRRISAHDAHKAASSFGSCEDPEVHSSPQFLQNASEI